MVDPPWDFHLAAAMKKGADPRYDVMSMADIKALPVATWRQDAVPGWEPNRTRRVVCATRFHHFRWSRELLAQHIWTHRHKAVRCALQAARWSPVPTANASR